MARFSCSFPLLAGLVLLFACFSEHAAAFMTQPLALRADSTKRCTATNAANSLNMMGSGYFLRPRSEGGQGSKKDNEDKDSKNEELAFKSVISNLKGAMGREGFQGEDAKKHLKIVENVEQEAEAEEKKFLGSRRLYKFTKAATRTLTRPIARKNHPGEEYRESRH